MKSALIDAIEQKNATVGVIGLGYVGLPLLLCFAEKGFRVIGFDIDGKKTAALERGESYIKHIPASRISRAVKTGRFSATTDFAGISSCDAVIIAVPTPLTKNREPDVSYIIATCESIVPFVRRDQLIVLESTTYPGTTDEVLVPIIERSGLKVDRDIHVAFSPEREDPSRTDYHDRNHSQSGRLEFARGTGRCGRALSADRRPDGAGLVCPRRGGHQAGGEHLQGREHRPGE